MYFKIIFNFLLKIQNIYFPNIVKWITGKDLNLRYSNRLFTEIKFKIKININNLFTGREA